MKRKWLSPFAAIAAYFVVHLFCPAKYTAYAQVQTLKTVGHAAGGVTAVDLFEEIAVAGIGPRLVMIDVSDPVNPVEIGSRAFLEGQVTEIDVAGFYAYCTITSSGIRIVDLRDPNTMELVGSNTNALNAQDIEVVGDYAYVADFNEGLIVFDVSNPAMPKRVANLNAGNHTRLAVSGDLVFMEVSPGLAAPPVIDVSDPTNPTLVSELLDERTGDIDVSGNTVAIAGSAGLFLIDVSIPASPVQVGLFPGGFFDLLFDGDLVYLMGGDMTIVDVSDPSNPTQIAFLDTAVSLRQEPALAGGRLYVPQFSLGGMSIFDVSIPATPTLLGSFPGSVIGDEALTVSGNHLYAVDHSRLAIFDIADPLSPSLISTLFAPPASGTAFFDVAVFKHNAYLAANAEFQVVDVEDPASPSVVGSTTVTPPGWIRTLSIAPPYAVVGVNVDTPPSGSFAVLDIADPANPVELSSQAAPAAPGNHFLEGTTLYLATGDDGLRIYDLSDPTNPAEIGAFDSPLPVRDVVVADGYAYLGEGAGLRVLDVTDPATPVEVSSLPGAADTFGMTLHGSRVFLQGQPQPAENTVGGISIISVRDPFNPAVIANGFPVSAGPGPRPYIGQFAYVAGDGVSVVAIPPPAPVLDPLPRFINANGQTITGTADEAGSFVTAGGAIVPVFEQLSEVDDSFSLDVTLRQEAVNTLSVTTMNEFGLVSLPAIATVVEGDAFPTTVETVTTLTISPDPASAVPLNGSLTFTCEATFSDSSTADVTEFVVWEEIANGELVTEGGLYVNTKAGTAQVRAAVAGVFSNVVSVGDV